jgi:hypothetical protein
MHRAQIAIMPTNNASDVSAAASSTTARTIRLSHVVEHKANIVPFLFSSQRAHRDVREISTKTRFEGGFFVRSRRTEALSVLALTWK